MADLGNMANRLLRAASQLSPVPNRHSRGSGRSRREIGRDDMLRGPVPPGPPPPPPPGRFGASAAGPDGNEGMWPPSGSPSSFAHRDRGGYNDSPRGFLLRDDGSSAPPPPPPMARYSHHRDDYGNHSLGREDQYHHQHPHQQGRSPRSYGSGGGGSADRSYVGDQRMSVDGSRDWDRERGNAYRRSNGDDSDHRRSYHGGVGGGGGYSGRSGKNSSVFSYHGEDYGYDHHGEMDRGRGEDYGYDHRAEMGDGRGAVRRWRSSSAGRERDHRSWDRGGSAQADGKGLNGNGVHWEREWQRDAGGAGTGAGADGVDNHHYRGSTNNRREGSGPQMLRRPGGGGDNEGGDEVISVDSDSPEEAHEHRGRSDARQKRQHQRVSQPLPSQSPPPLPPPPRRPQSAQSNGDRSVSSSCSIGARSLQTPPPQQSQYQEHQYQRQQLSEKAPRKRSRGSSGGSRISATAQTDMDVEAPPMSREPLEITSRLGAASLRRLADPVDARREGVAAATAAENEEQRGATRLKCPHTSCPLHKELSLEPNAMAAHLVSHTREATEMQSIRGYVRSTVAEVLHDVCMDVLVAPPQRNFDKRRMNSALVGSLEGGLGMPAAMLETKVLGKIGNPAIRRCAYELASGSCEGVGKPEHLPRCDICGTWMHISCGGISIGGSIEPVVGWTHTKVPAATGANPDAVGETTSAKGACVPIMKEECICQACAHSATGPYGRDGPPGTVSVLASGRGKRKRMLDFLEREAVEGWPNGVFDLN
ncbi:unnamed protein product, partial [Sphacelaria rigidula]